MSDGGDQSESARLAGEAEAARRAGDVERARSLAQEALDTPPAHPAAYVAQALALIDSGDLVTAHRALEWAFEALGGELAAGPTESAAQPAAIAAAPLADSELESAFEAAEAQPSEMQDANHVAAAALRLVEEGRPEGVDLAAPGSVFATETVADLLERQGQGERARDVRSAARARGRFREAQLDDAQRERVVRTLSRWLDNLRRRTA